MTTFPCRPFIEKSILSQTVVYNNQNYVFMYDGFFLCVSYPTQKVDEFLGVQRGTAWGILQNRNPVGTFFAMKPNLIPVLMFTENFVGGAWQTGDGRYITTK